MEKIAYFFLSCQWTQVDIDRKIISLIKHFTGKINTQLTVQMHNNHKNDSNELRKFIHIIILYI